MNINRYIWSQTTPEQRKAVLSRVQGNANSVQHIAHEIVESVRKNGDTALLEYTARFDGPTLTAKDLLVSVEEFENAEKSIEPALRAALESAHRNIERHHRLQVPPPSWMDETSPGVISGERISPIASVALYVPRGKGSFPSVMLMLCVPARIAGVPRIIVCTPPGPDGKVDAASLVAARICGVDTVYKIGGAQAISALAYGTATIPKVDKVVGPGNQYVSAAKRLLYGVIDPGPPAGPSESIVVADGFADPQVVAREWLVEAEHGPDSAALLVTDSTPLADAVQDLVPSLVAKLPEQRQSFITSVLSGYGGIVLTTDSEESLAFVNEYAPEHLRVIVQSPLEWLPRIKNAGEILLGEYSSIPFGNFAIGLNAILPTGGTARSHSSVGVHTFMKYSSFAFVSAAGAADLGPVAVELARWEGFPAHEEAARYAFDRANRQ